MCFRPRLAILSNLGLLLGSPASMEAEPLGGGERGRRAALFDGQLIEF